MSLTAREIELVATELAGLAGAFVQKVSVTAPRTVWLELRHPGASHLLLICAEQGLTRLHVAADRPASPEPPFAFQGLLRAELMGSALQAVEVVPGERAATLRFAGKTGARALVTELTGRHGNLFLLDEAGVIRGSAVPNLSERRDNRAGRPYQPLLARARPPEDESQSRFPGGEGPFAISAQIERAYAGRERAEQVAERRRLAAASLKARRGKLTRTVAKVEQDVARTGAADDHRRRGELLKANLHGLKRGMREVSLTEYAEDGPHEVVVPLDPARTPRENLEREFHQYRRLLSGQARAGARLQVLRAELAEVDARLAALACATDEEILALPIPGGARPALPGRKARAPARPFREYASTTGQRIRVGKGARENDLLTFRHSKGNDLWLHARGVPGAHVVVPLERGEEAREETVRDAALLAAHHSDARGDAVEVACTRVKHVRKVKGAPGAVTFSQDRTMLVRPDPERLSRVALVEESG
jgi:predicted ribosome quality control (RQC) complex YloA/Tae2 family protein